MPPVAPKPKGPQTSQSPGRSTPPPLKLSSGQTAAPPKPTATPTTKPKATPKKAAPKAVAPVPVPTPNPISQPTGMPTISTDIMAFVQKYYGDYMMHFLTDPEIGPIILQAAQQGITSPDRLKGMLANTNWWKNTSNSAAQWERLSAENPAEAEAQTAKALADINDQAALLGLKIDPKRAKQIAEDTLKYGWSSTQLVDSLVHEAEIGGTTGQGSIDVTTQQIKALAHQYMLPLGDQDAFGWAVKIAKGEMSMDTVKMLLGEQAKSRFPAMASIIDQGGTPADYFAPYKQIAATTLEIPPDSVDFTSGKWSTVLQSPDDPNQPMRLTDFERMLKTDPKFGYQYTNGANQSVDSLTLFLGDRFGAATS